MDEWLKKIIYIYIYIYIYIHAHTHIYTYKMESYSAIKNKILHISNIQWNTKYSHYIVRCLPMTYNWKFVYFCSLHLFCQFPTPCLLQPLSVLSSVFNFFFFNFYYSTYKWDYMILSFCLTYFTYHNVLNVQLCSHKWQNFIYSFIHYKIR